MAQRCGVILHRGENMRKLAILLVLFLLLAGCGEGTKTSPSPAPSAEPTDAVSAEPTAAPSDQPEDDPSAAPSDGGTPDTPGIEQMIREKWAADRPEDFPLDYGMMTLSSELLLAKSDCGGEKAAGGADYLLRITGDENLYEIVAYSPWFDEEGYQIYQPDWRSGENGAGVDIETGEYYSQELTFPFNYAPPVSGETVVGTPALLGKVGDGYVFYAHSKPADAPDYEQPTELFVMGVPGGEESDIVMMFWTIAYNEGHGWSTLEG